jgi:hypothetical protein
MQPGGTLLIGAARDVVNETTLTATYGIEIGVFLAQRASGSGELTFCSPW